MEDANLHKGWLTAWGRPGMGAQFRLTVPRRAGGVIESSPLPLVPRDLVLPALPIEPGIATSTALTHVPDVADDAADDSTPPVGLWPDTSTAVPPPPPTSPPPSPSPSDAAGATR
jgi:two-component system sensor histidine kinase MtrB